VGEGRDPVNLFAVIPSGNRPAELTRLVKALVTDGVHVIVVNTGYELCPSEWLDAGTPENPVAVVNAVTEPKNISRWWNFGLELAAEWNDRLALDAGLYESGQPEYVVAVLNDDIVVESGFVHALAHGIIYHDVAISYPDVFGMGRDQVFHQPSHWRMSGYAFALRGSMGIRADESMVWWYGDNDIEWQAFALGAGTVTVGGLKIQHLYPSQSTVGELAEQAGRDRATFVQKWGAPPW
jgi:hypothetical protein